MSTSLLAHAFGIPTGYEYQCTHYAGGEVSFVIKEKKHHLRCVVCESRNVILRGSHLRRFRTLPIGNRPVWIEFAVPRLECGDCQSIRQARIRFANGSARYTRRFRTLVLVLSRHMTIKAVADYLHVGWDLVKEIQKKYLLRRYGRLSPYSSVNSSLVDGHPLSVRFGVARHQKLRRESRWPITILA